MTSEHQKPPDEGGGGVGTIEDSSQDTKKSSEESTTGEKSLGSSAVAGEETISNEASATGEKSLGSYASVAASATKDPWSSAESKLCKARNYEEILKESKDEAKNVLNVRIEKIRSQEWVQGLTQEDVEHILFNELKIDVDAVVEVDITSRYNFKEIIFKKDHDIVKYQRPPFLFKGHMVTAGSSAKLRNMVKITFRNVPRSVPDEELLHFCSKFGHVHDRTVFYGKYFSGNFAGLHNGTRWLNIELTSKVPINFIWLEGPEDNESVRVTVTLGAGGETQCGHCLQTGAEGCPGRGKAKICREKKTKRAEIDQYMKSLFERFCYKTLKSDYFDWLKEKKDEENEKKEEDLGPKEKEKTDDINKKNESKEENEKLKKEIKALNEKIACQENRELNWKNLRKTILKDVEESLAEPLFADSNLSKLVAQFSLTLQDNEYHTDDKGFVILNNDVIFKGMKLTSEDEKENEIMKTNFAVFTKAVKEHTLVTKSADGQRRLSIGHRTASPKRARNPSNEDNGNEAKKIHKTPQKSGIPPPRKNKTSSKKNRENTQSLTTHHQTK